VQRTFENDWSLGLGFGRDRNSNNGFDNQWSSKDTTYHVGLAAKRRFGATKLGAVLSYGWSDTNVKRNGYLPEPFSTEMDRDTKIWSSTFRASHDFEFDAWYLRPIFDVGFTRLKVGSARETGASGINVMLESHNDTHSWLRPAFEVGKEFRLSRGNLLRFNVNLGVQHYFDGSTTAVEARLEGAPTDIEPMLISTDLGDPIYTSAFNIDLMTKNNTVLQINYKVSRSDDRDRDTSMVRLTVPF